MALVLRGPVAETEISLSVMRTDQMKLARWIRRMAILCLAAGIGLLLLNLVGVLVPPRDSQVYEQPRNCVTGDSNRVLTAEAVWSEAKRRPNETNREYVARLKRLVHDGTAFLPEENHPDMRKSNWRVPIYKNYLLWGSRRALFLARWARGAVSWTERGSLYRYVFSDYRPAIERGVGLCDVQTVILMGLLKEGGIASRYISFSRHALVEAEVEPGVWWVLDPSLKTVLPYDVPTLRKNPGLIQAVCLEHGKNPPTSELLLKSFAEPPPRPFIYNSVKEAHGPAHYYIEFASCYLCWIIPAALLAVGFACLRFSHARRST